MKPPLWGPRCTTMARIKSLSLLAVILLVLSCTNQVAGSSLSSMEAVYIVGTIFLLYLVVDIFLVIVVIACIQNLRNSRRERRYNLNKSRIRRSLEFLEGDVKLQIRRKQKSESESSNSSEYQEETSFAERKQEAIQNRSSIDQRESEQQLLGDPEDSLTPMLAATAKIAETEETIFVEDNEHQLSPNKSFEERKREAQEVRLQNSNLRKDSEAPLLTNEVNVDNTLTPVVDESGETVFIKDKESSMTSDNDDQVKQTLSSLKPPVEDTNLVSITSSITGAIIPPDSPPHSIPQELKSLDVSMIGSTTESSFMDETSNTGHNKDPLHSSSGVSIGWNTVNSLMNEVQTDVNETIMVHGKPENNVGTDLSALGSLTPNSSFDLQAKSTPSNDIKQFMSKSYGEATSSIDDRSRSLSPESFIIRSHPGVKPSYRSSDPGIIVQQARPRPKNSNGSLSHGNTPIHTMFS